MTRSVVRLALLAVVLVLLAFTPAAGQSATRTYYVDCNTGSDTATGTSWTSAWRTIAMANTAPLAAGMRLSLRRGCSWSEHLRVSWTGTVSQPIVVGAYGTGALPILRSQTNGATIVTISGSYTRVENISARADPPGFEAGCQNQPKGYIVGFSFLSGAAYNMLRSVEATGSYAGVYIKSGSHHNRVLDSRIVGNVMMNPLNPTPNNDAGAFGVLLHGDDNEISGNVISGHDACSYDYGRDGAAVEVYGGQRNSITHNFADGNDAFTELGNNRSADNTYAYNLVTSSLTQSTWLVTRGAAETRYGPVLRTRAYHNTVYLTGGSSEGFVCHAGCSPDVLTLRGNIIQAVQKVGYADAPFGEDYNLYWGGARQFVMGAHSKVANPLFVDPVSGAFRLRVNSPAVDAGSLAGSGAGYVLDLDGVTVPSGGAADLGAYEWTAAR